MGQRLFGHGQRLLHALALGNLALQARIEQAQFCGFALKEHRLRQGAARQKVKGQRQQDRKSHDLQRQNAVDAFAHGIIGGEGDKPPSPERNPGGRLHHRLALHIGIRRLAGGIGPVRRRLEGALQRIGRIDQRNRILKRQATPARLGGQHHHALAVRNNDGILQPGPGPLVLGQINLDHNHPDRPVLGHQRARIAEAKTAFRAFRRREHRFAGPLRLDEKGLSAVICPDALPRRRGHHPSAAVQQQDRGRTDFGLKGDQPLRGEGKAARGQRANQLRVAREQQRHHGIALQFGQDVPRIQRQPQFGAAAGCLGEALGQPLVGEQNHADGKKDQPGNGQPHAPGQSGLVRSVGLVLGAVRLFGHRMTVGLRQARLKLSGSDRRKRAEDRAENYRTIGSALCGVNGAFRMRHQAKDPAVL